MSFAREVKSAGAYIPEIKFEESSLIELEEVVNRSVTGLEEALSSIGTTLREKKSHEADLFADVRILHAHMKTVAILASRIGEVLKGNPESDPPAISHCSFSTTVGYVETVSAVTAVALTLINNVIKTIDLSATSSVGWAALAVQGVSEICSKMGDKINVSKLSKAQMKTKLRELESRLSVLDKAHTMAKLFKLFEVLRRGEKESSPKMVLSGVELCGRIPETLKTYITPEELMMQILAVSKIDLKTVNTKTKLGRAVVRVIEQNREKKVLENLESKAAAESIRSLRSDLTVKELVVHWNDSAYQIERALMAVDEILVDRLKEPGELLFTSIIDILNGEIGVLKNLSERADALIYSKRGFLDHISYQNKLLISSVIETLITAGTDTSFILFNLMNPDSIKAIWLSGMVTLVGPILAKMNKVTAEAVIEEEIDRQLLIKMRDSQSFIESTETFAFTLRSIQDMQSTLTMEQLTELMETCRVSGAIGGLVSQEVMRGVVAQQVLLAANVDESARKILSTAEKRARTECAERESVRELLKQEMPPSAEERLRRIRQLDMDPNIDSLSSKEGVRRSPPKLMKGVEFEGSNPPGEEDSLFDIAEFEEGGYLDSDDEETHLDGAYPLRREGSIHILLEDEKTIEPDSRGTSRDELLAGFIAQVARAANFQREAKDFNPLGDQMV